MSYPRIRRDPEANAAYVEMRPIGAGESVKTMPLVDDDGTVLIVIDFAASGEVLGIEFLDAATMVPERAADS